MSLKRAIILLFSCVLAFALAGTASAAAPSKTVASPAIKLIVNGSPSDLGSSLYVTQGKVFAEYGALFKLLGYETSFDGATKTIHANAEGVEILASVGGDVAFLNAMTVDSKGDVIQKNGHTYVGIRFAGTLTNHDVVWSGKAKTITLTYQGPTAEEIAAVYDVFNKMLLAEAAGDTDGMLALIADDTALDKDSILENWKSTKTKTVLENKAIESYSDDEAVVRLVENTTKVSGAFFPDNRSTSRYTLHKGKDGAWKIYNVEALEVEYTNIPGLFEQTATIPDAEKTAIGNVFADQMKAANEKNVDAYIATMTEIPDMNSLKTSLTQFFQSATMKVVADKWTIVSYNGSNEATLLASTTSEVTANGQTAKVHGVLLNDAVKVDGKWLLKAEATVLTNEQE